MDKFLMVIGQYGPHDEVEIRGTRAALADLRATIDKALEDADQSETDVFMPPDGEGFTIIVQVVHETWEQWQKRPAPRYYWNRENPHE